MAVLGVELHHARQTLKAPGGAGSNRVDCYRILGRYAEPVLLAARTRTLTLSLTPLEFRPSGRSS
jgi:hypothetical protein